MFALVPLVLFFPLGGVLANLLLGRRLKQPAAGIIASGASALAFFVALLQILALWREPEGTVVTMANWLVIDLLGQGKLAIPWAIRVDTLSATMMMVVTGVGTLIHIYAIGYMIGDRAYSRFFVYTNLFLAAMLLLVTADNYLIMFIGWEGVGLCSYLLIAFWFDRPADGVRNATAGRKAFVVNRVGDAGLILAMIIMFWQFQSLTFDEVFTRAAIMLPLGAPVAVILTLLLLVGAAGKSAQIPLFIWLPDAMAGPTPVSALIHAATMVTAGVYLIARSHVLFALAPFSQVVVAFVGATTALLAASMALAQFDINRVLAYSTISQLGFMIAAVGLGAYVAGLFHLITHAFFKALLFLAAGSVLHRLGPADGHMRAGPTRNEDVAPPPFDAQDMRRMGGLRRRMPTTFALYLVGALALAGLPPLAGFFSKDEILVDAWHHNPIIFGMLLAAAFLTAVYIGRQVLLVFYGEARTDAAAHAHESTQIMIIPMLGLSLLAALGGALNLPGFHSLAHWLGHTIPMEAGRFSPAIALFATGVTLGGVAIAYTLYGHVEFVGTTADPLARYLGYLYLAFKRQWWIDNGIRRILVRPYVRLAWSLIALAKRYEGILEKPYHYVGAVVAAGDARLFGGFDSRLVALTRRGAALVRTTQTGQLNWNVAGIVGTIIIVMILLLLWR